MAAKTKRKYSPWQTFSFGSVTFTVGTKSATTINVGVVLKDDNGQAVYARAAVQAWLSTLASGADVVGTAPNGGVAAGTNGYPIPLVAGKVFTLITDAQGRVDINLTDSGTPAFYLVLMMPDGTLQVSSIIQF